MKKIFKKKGVRILVIILGTLLILYLLAWRFLLYVPLDWVRYSNTFANHNYSFSYPKNWVLTECGNGEVVVAKKAMDKCYRPLGAPKDYLDNVYFQTFLPGNNYTVSLGEVKLPDNLTGWKTITEVMEDDNFLGGYSNFSTPTMILDPIETDQFVLHSEKTNQDKYAGIEHRILVGKQSSFILGFYPHPELGKEYSWVVNSLNYTDK